MKPYHVPQSYSVFSATSGMEPPRQSGKFLSSSFIPKFPLAPYVSRVRMRTARGKKSIISLLPRFLLALPSRIGTFGIPATPRLCLLLNRDYKNQDWAQKCRRVIIRNNLKLNFCTSTTPKGLSFGPFWYLSPLTSRKSKLGQVHTIWIVNMEISSINLLYFLISLAFIKFSILPTCCSCFLWWITANLIIIEQVVWKLQHTFSDGNLTWANPKAGQTLFTRSTEMQLPKRLASVLGTLKVSNLQASSIRLAFSLPNIPVSSRQLTSENKIICHAPSPSCSGLC